MESELIPRDKFVQMFKEIGANKDFTPLELEHLIINYPNSKIDKNLIKASKKYFKNIQRRTKTKQW